MSMQRKICWGAVAVTGLLFSSIGLEPAAGQGAAWQVQEVEASAPYRIFYQGDEIRFTARVQTGAELGQSVALVARQLRHRVPEHLPKDTAPEQNVVKSGWENIPGPAFEAGEATVKRDGQTLVLDCDVQIETLGAIRLLARHNGKEYKLADFIHVLPFNGVKPDEAVFTLNSVRRAEQADERFALYKRMGIQLVRAGGRTWEKDTMHLDWEFYDTLLAAMKKHDMRANFVIGGASMKMASYVQGEDEKWHTLIRYRGGSTPETTPSTEYLDVWAEQMGELARRFKGYARGYDFFNEPWELGSVSGTISGGAHIRRLIEWGAPAIKAADPGTKILAASSGPNALDSYLPYPKTTDAMDVMTMHTYSLQSMGAFLAPKYDLEVWDTESWEPMMERNLPMKVAHQIHQGYGAIKPMNQAESPAEARQASWAVVITAQRMLEGMKPAGYAMEGKVPVVLLYEGRGHAAAFIHGTSEYYGSKFYNPTPLRQIERNAANTGWGPWTIGHYVVPAEGLTVRDVYGNPLASEGDVYRIPLGQSGVYVTADNIDQLREAMQAGQLRGVKPFTIAIRDITERLQPGAEVRVKLTNVYPTPKKATVSLDGHGVLDFGGRTVRKTLPAGQSATFSFPVVEVADHPGNAYRITARAENEGQTYSYGENINVAVIARGTVEIDGDLDDWKKLDAVPVRVSDQRTYTDPTAEYQRLPVAEISREEAAASLVEAQAAWDDDYFYFAARVVDRTENRRESNAFGQRHAMHGWPNQQVYLGPAQLAGRAGDVIMLSFNTNEDHKKHWDFVNVDHPLWGVYPYPDTDFEFEVYPVRYNEDRARRYAATQHKKVWEGYPESDVWRLYDPKMTFRHHAYPLNLPSVRQKHDQNLVPGARSVVRREGDMWVYELAIPWDQLWEIDPTAGERVKFTFYQRDNGRHGLEYAKGKSVSAANVVTFHPIWERFWSNETEWGFVE